MQVKAVFTGEVPATTFRPFDLTISVRSSDEDEALRKFGGKNVSIPDLLVQNADLQPAEKRALKTIQSGILDARVSPAPYVAPVSGKVTAARLKQ